MVQQVRSLLVLLEVQAPFQVSNPHENLSNTGDENFTVSYIFLNADVILPPISGTYKCKYGGTSPCFQVSAYVLAGLGYL